MRRIFGIGHHRIVVRNRPASDPDMAVTNRRIADVARTLDRDLAAPAPKRFLPALARNSRRSRALAWSYARVELALLADRDSWAN
ncbi:hypothetical protein AB3Y40_01345 [Yoonia sp. R2331]|uniref:hypothetical protein n=1 Tax=Yoonia sp. R2331 TaxID=3237238 RepID=UPI0034E4A872